MAKDIFECEISSIEYHGEYIEGHTEILGNNLDELTLVITFNWISLCGDESTKRNYIFDDDELEQIMSNDEVFDYLVKNYDIYGKSFEQIIDLLKKDEKKLAAIAFDNWCEQRS